MITPLFEVKQNDTHIIVRAKLPFVKVDEIDFYVTEYTLSLFSRPYFLRLTFDDLLNTVGEDHSGSYDYETCLFPH